MPYEQRHPVRHYGRSYDTDRARSLVPGAQEQGPASAPPAPTASGVGRQEPSDPSYTPARVRRVLPLGVGMLLTGLGLGLGFIGLRLRRS